MFNQDVKKTDVQLKSSLIHREPAVQSLHNAFLQCLTFIMKTKPMSLLIDDQFSTFQMLSIY